MPDTLIKVDLSQSPYENDRVHNRWHPDIPMVASAEAVPAKSSPAARPWMIGH